MATKPREKSGLVPPRRSKETSEMTIRITLELRFYIDLRGQTNERGERRVCGATSRGYILIFINIDSM